MRLANEGNLKHGKTNIFNFEGEVFKMSRTAGGMMGCKSNCSEGAGEGVCLWLGGRASRMEDDGIPLIGSNENRNRKHRSCISQSAEKDRLLLAARLVLF